MFWNCGTIHRHEGLIPAQEARCVACANNSLPTPDSPVTSKGIALSMTLRALSLAASHRHLHLLLLMSTLPGQISSVRSGLDAPGYDYAPAQTKRCHLWFAVRQAA
jgi:hypothetical protein